MKVAILAGGLGSRLSEETMLKPKPMVEIGGHPILWHIMNIYAHHGFKDFIVALGYKGGYIKKYFMDYCTMAGDMAIDLERGTVTPVAGGLKPDWHVKLVDTGIYTNTGGRIKRLAPHVGNETFMLTWGDGVADIDVDALLDFHRSHGKLATLTAVHPVARFGHLEIDGDRVAEFSEKPQTKEGWINGAFFVLEPGVFDYIEGDHVGFDYEPMTALARDGQLMAYKHTSFWQCMDTLREKRLLEELWASGEAPWKIW
ncbi:MAG: glucose-1-phosphate cytidylyltransferase [Myxococcota bacterium]